MAYLNRPRIRALQEALLSSGMELRAAKILARTLTPTFNDQTDEQFAAYVALSATKPTEAMYDFARRNVKDRKLVKLAAEIEKSGRGGKA